MTHLFTIPEFCLMLLVGPSGSGKSHFARTHFKETEVVSSDGCRAMISDDPSNQSCSADGFDLLHRIVQKRLKRGKLTVVDATNLAAKNRKKLISLAHEYYAGVYGVIFNLPFDVCLNQNEQREGRVVSTDILRKQYAHLQESLPVLQSSKEWTKFIVIHSLEDANTIQIQRQSWPMHHLDERGPFDIIGDVHGCYDELMLLLTQLGYHVDAHNNVTHPNHRKVIFVGDLVDRGPKNPEVLRLVMTMVATGMAFCVCGNHDDKLSRKLQGRDVKLNNGLENTMDQLASIAPAHIEKIKNFLQDLPHHIIFDQGKLVIAHGGISQNYIGHDAAKVRAYCLFGPITGEIDEYGLPVRYPWSQEYQGKAIIVYGHTPISQPQWINNTINIDTGCVYGHQLTALRYPERELVGVNALKTYYHPRRPFMEDYEPH